MVKLSPSLSSSDVVVVALKWSSANRVVVVYDNGTCCVFDTTTRAEVFAGRVADLDAGDATVCADVVYASPSLSTGDSHRRAVSMQSLPMARRTSVLPDRSATMVSCDCSCGVDDCDDVGGGDGGDWW